MDIPTSREIIQRLKKEGWAEMKGQGKGSHRKFNNTRLGTTTVPRTITPNTYMSIAKKAGWR